MADGIKISQLPQLTQANLDNNDEIPIVDVSDRATKRVTKSALLAAPFDPIDVNSGTIDGTTIGASSPSTGAFTTLNVGSSTTVNGVLDEDNMASNDPAKLATQQSIKAYVDAQVATSDTLSEVLANGNTTGDITSTGTSTFSNIDINGGTIDGITDLAVADGGTGASTAAGARTNLNVDVAGTDNSTNVTLAGSYNYLTLSGQQITLDQIDLATDVTGALPTANLTVVNSNTGSFGSSTLVPVITVNDKGLITAVTTASVSSGTVDLTTDVTGILPIANGGTGSSTAAGARTNLDVDQAGTAVALAIALG